MEIDPKDKVKLSNVLPRLMSETLNDFAENLAMKSIAILAGIICLLSISCSCCKMFNKFADKPEAYI